MSDIDITLAERGSRYGEFDAHAEITQSIKDAMQASKNWPVLDDDMKEALEMVAHKVGRILNGDPSYIDSWTDIIGYTRLVEKRLIAEQTAAKAMMDGMPSSLSTLRGDLIRKASLEKASAAQGTTLGAAPPAEAEHNPETCVFCLGFEPDKNNRRSVGSALEFLLHLRGHA